jgi:PA14 domain
MNRHALTLLAGLALVASAARSAAQDDNDFGSATKTAGTMLGIFYDLKQNQKRQPIPAKVDDMKIIAKFIDSGWDESLLNRFFRATKPLYATQVLIPSISAAGAPAAFGLAGIVKPSHWIIIYKAQVSPPEDGTYRFVGTADDAIAVAVNSKTVLVQDFYDSKASKWKAPDPASTIRCWVPSGLKRGDWFTCKKDEIIDLDILISEIPGNLFGAWLLIEKQGATYPRNGGQPLLPAFQVKAKPIKVAGGEHYIPFSVSPTPWICHP